MSSTVVMTPARPQTTISQIAPASAAVVETRVSAGNFCTYLLWFILAFVVVWVILQAVQPAFVQRRDAAGQLTGQIDTTRIAMWSAVIALVVVVLVWLFRGGRPQF